ncbi:MAG TPA: hypothetical protein VM008_05980 [Phycisphaerae bacterium]|nr:hypothetical protein [Phycisphaerae bacterium]
MIDVAQFARRVRRRTRIAAVLFFGGALMLVVDFTTKLPTPEKGEFAFVWLFAMGLGGFIYYLSMELPTKEIMRVAKENNGLVCVGEIATTLDITPDLALRALRHLQRIGIAQPRWEELQKNLWEFPDYMQLPIADAIDLARKHGGKLTLQDLVASGHTLEVAQQTFETIQQKGLGRDQGGETPAIILGAK